MDNVSTLPDWLSGSLCRMVSGTALAQRKLYTDGDQVVFRARRPVILTSIDNVITRSDLADRSLLMLLPRIASDVRKEESQLWRSFEEARPRILGAMLDLMADVLKIRSEIDVRRAPRMADFARTGAAVAKVLGFPDGHFEQLYGSNRRLSAQLTIEADTLGRGITEFAAGLIDSWEGSATELFHDLAAAALRYVDTTGRDWLPHRQHWARD
ncbi:MAG: hypothetical protein R3C29_02805 [Dehalococcoidia bacterium]